jgi:hypothetical protein
VERPANPESVQFLSMTKSSAPMADFFGFFGAQKKGLFWRAPKKSPLRRPGERQKVRSQRGMQKGDFFGADRKKVRPPLRTPKTPLRPMADAKPPLRPDGGRQNPRSAPTADAKPPHPQKFFRPGQKTGNLTFLVYDKVGKIGLSESEKPQDSRKPAVLFAPSRLRRSLCPRLGSPSHADRTRKAEGDAIPSAMSAARFWTETVAF